MLKRLLVSLMLVGLAPVLCGFIFSKSVGKLNSDTGGVSMKLEGPWWSKVDIGPEAKGKELNSGVSQPKNLTRVLVRKSAGKEPGTQVNETCRLNSYGPWGKLSKIKVEKDKTTVLKFGGPVSIKTDANLFPTRGNPSGKVVSVGMKIVGEYGEVYSGYVFKGGKLLKPPSFKILAEDGKELASGKFEYG